MDIGVLFVCLANICRSPMAEVIFRQLVSDADLKEYFRIDSAGTANWLRGYSPHQGTQQVLRERGISTDNLFSRSLTVGDLSSFDYILANGY